METMVESVMVLCACEPDCTGRVYVRPRLCWPTFLTAKRKEK